jgi:hypothetical protein
MHNILFLSLFIDSCLLTFECRLSTVYFSIFLLSSRTSFSVSSLAIERLDFFFVACMIFVSFARLYNIWACNDSNHGKSFFPCVNTFDCHCTRQKKTESKNPVLLFVQSMLCACIISRLGHLFERTMIFKL